MGSIALLIPLSAIILRSEVGKAIAERLKHGLGTPPEHADKLLDRLENLENKLSSYQKAEELKNRITEHDTAKVKDAVGPSQSTVTILFSDIEDFTRFVDRGDEVAHEILQIHNRIVRDQIKKYEGQEVKNYGDGFMVSFASARNAVLCALDVQQIFKTYNFRHVDPIRVRIGINSGEPIKEQSDYIGRAVNLAARIADQARGGEIWTSDLLKQLVGPSRDFQFIDRGAYQLQGFSDSQQLCEVLRIEAIESPETRELEERLQELEDKIKKEQGLG